MENYILKLNSGTEYKLYKGTTLVSDADLTTLFSVVGEMYLSFDFNSGTPSSLTTFTITDSSDNAVIANTNVTVAEGKNYKATWSAGATTFDTFEELAGKALDESQLSFLMGKIKEGGASVAKELVLSEDNTVNYSGFRAFNKIAYLEPGLYTIKYDFETTPTNVYISDEKYDDPNAAHTVMLVSDGASFIISGATLSSYRTVLILNRATNSYGKGFYGYFGSYNFSSSQQPGYAGTTSVQNGILTGASIIDNLNGSSGLAVLSANQGKNLADRIGTLSSLTTTTKTSAVAAINEVNGRSTYSTTEQVVGTWIDGKPLYRVTLSLSSTDLAEGSVSMFYKLPNSTTFNLKKAYGVVSMSAGVVILGATIWAANDTIQYITRVEKSSDGYITFLATKSNSQITNSAEVTIEYTKTTD